MNKDNAAQFLPLVRALADGKTIQFNSDDEGWIDVYFPGFTSEPHFYRIKSEPREWDIWEMREVSTITASNMTAVPGWQKIRVREILD